MIGKASRWQDVAQFIRFLYGPGDRERHQDPHLIAGDRAGPYLNWLEPGPRSHGGLDFGPLIAHLTLPFAALRGIPGKKPVWHCLLRAAPEDRPLADAEWSDAAHEVMASTGLAAADDDNGVRWVAIRHGDDHIHVITTLARQDGERADPRRDYPKVRSACQAIEDRYDLRRTGRRISQTALALS